MFRSAGWMKTCSNVFRTSYRPSVFSSSVRASFPRPSIRPPHFQRAHASQYPWPGRRPQYSRFDGGQNSRPTIPAVAIWRNHQGKIIVIVTLCGVFYVSNLEKVEISGRWRFNCLSPENEAALTQGQYEQVLQAYKHELLPANHPSTQMAHRIVSRIIHSNGLESQKWIVHVIEDETVNAFCMAGGQIFVFTGILKYTQDESGLATVLGHEMGHRVARHTAEQMSGRIWAIAFMIVASLLLDVSGNASRWAYNLVFDLRNSRTAEDEADQLGLLMMAKACYDPESAIPYWTRMMDYEKSHGGSPPQILSTHPASKNRVQHLQKLLPDAMKVAEQSNCTFTKGMLGDFRNTISGGGSVVQAAGSDDYIW